MAALNQATIIKGLERLTSNLNKSTFFFDFLKIYGFSKLTVQKLEKNDRTRNIGLNPEDYGLTKQIYFHPIHTGDVNIELEELLKNQAIKQHKVRFLITTDFRTLAAYDFVVDDSISIDISDLRSNYDFFLPLTGKYEKPSAYSAHPADLKACEKMGRLYDIIRVLNHYDDSNLHSLNVFLTRLLFCFFAEDTGIFPVKGQMTDALVALTTKDGKDLHIFFNDLFKILDIPEDSDLRKKFSSTLQRFPYVNGGLFREVCEIPTLDSRARNILIDCGRLTWNNISPVIFGSMFQAVMNPKIRHELGAHYTSERNIFKVIRPLFLNDLEKELESILDLKTKSIKLKKLYSFQNKICSLQFLDPAAGCGNFLVVSFRELKKLELKAVDAILNIEDQQERSVFMDWTSKYSKVSINQFHGMEIEEFPVDVARVSMWLMEHVMNRKFGERLGAVIPSIPLKTSAHIVCTDALTEDWNKVVSCEELNFIFGNPPFAGTGTTTPQQKKELRDLFKGQNIGYLDYCAAWFKKASLVMLDNPNVRSAFVSTNSLFQGQQVDTLWKGLFEKGFEIDFAYKTFSWDNEAKYNAGVHCCICGFSSINCKNKADEKIIYTTTKKEKETYITSKIAENINGYLLDAPNIIVKSIKDPLTPRTCLNLGNKSSATKSFILTREEYESAKENNHPLLSYMKPYIGATEFLNNTHRYCIWLVGLSDEEIKNNPAIQALCESVRIERSDANGNIKAQHKGYPFHLFRQVTQPADIPCLVIPCVTSERRTYVPMAIVDKDTIVGNRCFVLGNPTLMDFGLLMSKMHMTWMKTVCGRLESRFNYSNTIVYNTFPMPLYSDEQRKIIENLSLNILFIRETYPEKTLAELYDPEKMPLDLLRAHQELDKAVDSLYRKEPFASDEDRLEHLFKRYEQLTREG